MTNYGASCHTVGSCAGVPGSQHPLLMSNTGRGVSHAGCKDRGQSCRLQGQGSGMQGQESVMQAVRDRGESCRLQGQG